jgi:subtilisin family serine protease
MKAAIESALAADVVVVASIGNKPEALLPVLPAAYDGVVAVGAIDQNGNIASLSVTGPEMVLTAPGVRVVSTDKTGYAVGDGTSAATAIVAGAAALVRSKYPNLSAKEVVHRLTATATDKGPPGRDPQYGYGVVNLVGALTAAVPPLTPSATPSRPVDPTKPAAGATNAAGPGHQSSAGGNSAMIIVASAVVVLGAAGIAGWVLLRRRGRAPAA